MALALAVAGCATAPAPGPTAQRAGPLTRAMRAIGLAKPAPTQRQLPLRIFTAQNLNAGPTRRALALVVKVYHLRSLAHFRHMPFAAFLDQAKAHATLGDDLLASREMLLLPDQRYVSVEHIPLATRYLGFVALFRGPAAHRWRFAYDVERSTASGITLGVHACAMTSTAGALVTPLPDEPGALASVHCPAPGS